MIRRLALASLLLLSIGCPPTGPAPAAAPPPAANPTTPVEEASPPAPPAPAGTKTVVLAGEPAFATPPVCGSVGQARLVNQVFEGLCAFDEKLSIVPALAESWKISDDLTTYTFLLRPDLAFHDGSRLDAAAVVASFEVYAKRSADWFWVVEPIAGARAYREGKAKTIAGLRVIDARTVELRLVEPDGIFLHHLAMPNAGIMKEGASGPVGAGPWSHVSTTQREVVLAANRKHWKHGGPPADRLIVREVDDPVAALARGDVHAAPVGAAELDGIRVETYAGLMTEYAWFTKDVPANVRRLVNRVLDRDAYCKGPLGGTAIPSHGVVPPGMKGARPEALRFDTGEVPVLAEKTRLAASLEPALFDVLAPALAKHGVTLVKEPPFQLTQSGWIADYPDPDDYLRILFHSKLGPELNKTRFADPELDALVERARRMSADLEDDARMELYRKAEDRVIAAQPWLFLWHRRNRIGVSPKLRGLRLCAADHAGSTVLAQTELDLDAR